MMMKTQTQRCSWETESVTDGRFTESARVTDGHFAESEGAPK